MIWESHYWKDDLLRRAKSLRGRKSQRRWPDPSLARVEQEVMLVAYSMRKLVEATKLSDDVVAKRVRARSHSAFGKRITRMNWHRIDELYDLESFDEADISTVQLCNQIIHSYVFVVDAASDGLQGFFVTSDHKRNERLLYLPIDEFIGLIEMVGNDYPDHVVTVWNEKHGDYRVSGRQVR